MPEQKLKIAIIGMGRFGSLMAEILSPYVKIFVISQRKLKGSKFKQINYKDLNQMDWIIPTVPIRATKDILKKIAPYIKKGAVVMDVCSVKVYPCRWLKKYLPKEVEILGSHPMFGPDSVKNNLTGLQIVFCPLRISRVKYQNIKRIFRNLKLKVIEATPSEHDQQSARSLALVHFIGRSLDNIKIREQTISTLGFKRLLQVCENVNNDTYELFEDMNKYNPYATKVRKQFLRALQNIDLKLSLKKSLIRQRHKQV